MCGWIVELNWIWLECFSTEEGTNQVDKHCWIRDYWKSLNKELVEGCLPYLSIKGKPEKVDFPYFRPSCTEFCQYSHIWTILIVLTNSCSLTYLCQLIKALTTNLIFTKANSQPGLCNYSRPQFGPQPDVQGEILSSCLNLIGTSKPFFGTIDIVNCNI